MTSPPESPSPKREGDSPSPESVGLIPLTPFSQERRGNGLEHNDLAPPSWGRGWGEVE